jgi:hypothetical protein
LDEEGEQAGEEERRREWKRRFEAEVKKGKVIGQGKSEVRRGIRIARRKINVP